METTVGYLATAMYIRIPLTDSLRAELARRLGDADTGGDASPSTLMSELLRELVEDGLVLQDLVAQGAVHVSTVGLARLPLRVLHGSVGIVTRRHADPALPSVLPSGADHG